MKWVLASTAAEDGTLWRAELEDQRGLLTDATRWVRSPRRAIADGELLAAGRYWAEDDQPRWTTAA